MDFFQTCTEASRPPELATLPAGAHLAAPLLRHAAEHSTLITLTQGMEEEEKEVSIRYGTYAYANKEAE